MIETAEQGAPTLSVTDLAVGYSSDLVLADVGIEVDKGQIALLAGRNGCGKSTLLKSICGFLRLKSGSVFLKGEDVTRTPPHGRLTRGLRYVPQDGGIFRGMTVKDNLLLSAFTLRSNDEESCLRTLDLLPPLKPLIDREAGQLSGGQQRLLACAMGLVTRPNVLLIDEPSAGLSPSGVKYVLQMLRDIRDNSGTAILLAEQNLREACDVADTVVLLRTGTVGWRGSPGEFLSHTRRYMYL